MQYFKIKKIHVCCLWLKLNTVTYMAKFLGFNVTIYLLILSNTLYLICIRLIWNVFALSLSCKAWSTRWMLIPLQIHTISKICHPWHSYRITVIDWHWNINFDGNLLHPCTIVLSFVFYPKTYPHFACIKITLACRYFIDFVPFLICKCLDWSLLIWCLTLLINHGTTYVNLHILLASEINT